jgi:serine/threonine-protein kinase
VTLTLSLGPEDVTVPSLAGSTYQEAVDKIQNLGLKIRREERTTDQVSQLDKVIDQDPASGSKLPKGDTVTVFIGTRPPDPTP